MTVAIAMGGCGGSTLAGDRTSDAGAPADAAAAVPELMTPPPASSGLPAGPSEPPPPPGMAWQHGAFANWEGSYLSHVTVTGGAAPFQSIGGGYGMLVSRTTPFYTIASSPGFWTLVDQEWRADAPSVYRHTMMLLDDARGDDIAARLPDADPTKGTVVVGLFGPARCFEGAATTVAIVPAGVAKVVYLDASLMPDATLTAVRKGGGAISEPRPAAALYDVEPNVDFHVEASSPCKQRPFPIAHEGVELTGKHFAQGGRSLSFYRVFLE